ncbi:hypothetical protein ZWY2020_025627 [Hordeum vulgare]|nr:hypothetical protein ZWY2020_025627 [Hordeum vulgare]
MTRIAGGTWPVFSHIDCTFAQKAVLAVESSGPKLKPPEMELLRVLVVGRPQRQRKMESVTGHIARSITPRATISKNASKSNSLLKSKKSDRRATCGDLDKYFQTQSNKGDHTAFFDSTNNLQQEQSISGNPVGIFFALDTQVGPAFRLPPSRQ